jgi:hypothetical protein
MLPDIATALVPINSTAWKTAQHFSYGARVLFARPSERSERLKLFVRVCSDIQFRSYAERSVPVIFSCKIQVKITNHKTTA